MTHAAVRTLIDRGDLPFLGISIVEFLSCRFRRLPPCFANLSERLIHVEIDAALTTVVFEYVAGASYVADQSRPVRV